MPSIGTYNKHMDYTFWVPTIISIVSIVWNYIQSRKILRLETEAEAKRLIHKIQFEKEFSIYSEMWGKLVDVKNATAELRPIMDQLDSGKTEDEIKMERLIKLQNSFNEAARLFQHNRPFYSKEIYNEVEKLLKTSRSEALGYQLKNKGDIKYWEDAEKNVKLIDSSVDKISDLIRKRIQVVNIV